MKTIGILGGMGPLATADLFCNIVTMTKAGGDSEHIPVLVDSNTRIPDRTAAILHGGESPLPELLRGLHRLEGMGAQIIIMPCNTSHWYYEQLILHTQLPFINMVEETGKEVQNLGIKRVGLLATDGALRVGIYDTLFQQLQIDCVRPDQRAQQHVMEMIYTGIKGGAVDFCAESFCSVLNAMESQGVEAFVLGCTELPIAFKRFSIPNKAINPTKILAARAIALAGGRLAGEADR